MLRGVLWLPFCLLFLGCGRNITAKQLGEPCTRTSQCEPGLICQAGVCRLDPDAGTEGSVDGGG